MEMLLETFDNSIDWIAVVVLAIFFTVLVVFLIAFFVGMAKSSKLKTEQKDSEKVQLKKDKVQKMLDGQNEKMRHNRRVCKNCGAKITRISGRCSVCGTMNNDID